MRNSQLGPVSIHREFDRRSHEKKTLAPLGTSNEGVGLEFLLSSITNLPENPKEKTLELARTPFQLHSLLDPAVLTATPSPFPPSTL